MNEFKQYRELFLLHLDLLCANYLEHGKNTYKSPKWLQYQGVEQNVLMFKSSQCGIGFYISAKGGQVGAFNFSEGYEYFKDLKYTFIKENYPTITEGGTK